MTLDTSELQRSFRRQFNRLGLPAGRPILLHTSLRRLGLGRDGARLLAAALLQAVEAGTSALLVPAFTYACEDPAAWVDPRLPREEWPARQALTPAFDPAATPVDPGLGHMPEHVRLLPGTRRSSHPVLSFAAAGPLAAAATAGQPLHHPQGLRSPLGWLYAQDGVVMMCGTGLGSMTLLHHAETIAPVSYVRATRRRVRCAAGWVWYWGAPIDWHGCGAPAGVLEAATLGKVLLGSAETRLVAARAFVDGALERLREDPAWLLCADPACPHCGPARRYLDGEIESVVSGDETAGDYAPATAATPPGGPGRHL